MGQMRKQCGGKRGGKRGGKFGGKRGDKRVGKCDPAQRLPQPKPLARAQLHAIRDEKVE
jgi:hypothetical protein